ncbi:MAG: ABC transporter ATP-binding protein [Desulfobacterota bacterium]|nr:ABC transporter ATP-binding protein [Thermodesulfobacteriota bacterium]
MNSAGVSESNAPLLQVLDVCKVYEHNGSRTEVLRNIRFDVFQGDGLAIIGPSGAGKTTLLNILGTLDRPTQGTVLYRGIDLFSRSHREWAAFRNQKLGFVFQCHHLLPEFTALENTMMPALIAGHSRQQATQRARVLLERIGLGHRLHHLQGELSGGEQQRVAVARALIMEPEILLADEPTGNLDSQTGSQVFDLLLEMNRKHHLTLIVVTHNETFARRMQRVITLIDGKIIDQ